jgi:glutaminyl-peptide cyclotransferase
MRFPSLFRALLFLGAAAAAASLASADDSYKIIHTYPHDPRAYTQGLVYVDGHLYESTGLNGRSSLRMDDLTTGRVLQSAPVPSQYFAEGLAPWGSTLVQLTWQSHIAFVYDRFSFRLLKTLHYDCEGWGLTEDGKNLIESDGTSEIRFFDPQTFREVRHITVKDHGVQVSELNELEYIHGLIYANVWHTDRIARIAPATGQVLGWINLAGLLPDDERTDPEAVLNGIAYDAAHDRLFVTGKLWPKLFEIKVVPAQAKMVPVHHSK